MSQDAGKQPLLSAGEGEQSVDDGERVGRIAGQVKVGVVHVEEVTVEGRRVGEYAAADGIGAGQDYDFRIGRGFVADVERASHVFRDGAGDDHAIGMTRRGYEFETETAHVEVNIARGPQFPFAAVVARGRYLTQLERLAEQFLYFGTYSAFVENDGLVFTFLYDKIFAFVGGQFIILGEMDFLGETTFAFAAESASTQIELQFALFFKERIGRTNFANALVVNAFVFRNNRTSAENARYFRLGDIGNKLFALMQ